MADTTTMLSQFLYQRLPQINADGGSASGVIEVNTTQAGTAADTNETDLWTYTLPANALSVNGRLLRITVLFQHAANANTKTTKLYFGSTVVSQFSGTNSNITGVMVAHVIRTSATAQLGWNVVMGPSNQAITTQPAIVTTPAETLSGAVTIKVTGQNGTASANDLLFKAAVIELLN